MSVRIQVKRGSRANLDALAGSNGLHQGELYWVTDESKFAVGVTVSTYVDIGPGSGGGATDLGQILTGTTVEITSSTGNNTTLAAAVAGGDAGVLTGADAQKIADAITALADDTAPQLGGPLKGAGNTIDDYLNVYNEQSGTTYQLVAADAGKMLVLSNAADITLNLPDDLAKGFSCVLIQGSTGAILPTTSGGAVLLNRQGHTRTAGNGAMASLIVFKQSGNSANYLLAGDTA